MAARHAAWRRLRGATDHADARALGNKLLGQLADMRRLSGVPTQEITRVMDDGTEVRARWMGNQPMVEIRSNKVKRTKLDIRVIDGLAVLPRTFADDNAFGARPEAILMPSAPGAVDATWLNWLYDDTYLDGVGATATGYYGTVAGKPVLADGIPGTSYTGQVDWRSSNQLQVVCWHGPQTRVFPNGDPFPQGREFIWYNGQVLLDATTTAIPDPAALSNLVLGAAIHANTLLFVLMAKESAGEMNLRVYKATLEPDFDECPWLRDVPDFTLDLSPRLAPLGAGSCELLLEVDMQVLNGYANPRFHFNQSANECRAIVHSYIFDDPPGQDYLRVSEFVIDFRAHLADPLDPVTYTDVDVVQLREDTTNVTTYTSARANAYVQHTTGGPNDGDEVPISYPYEFTIGGADTHFLPLAGSLVTGLSYIDGNGDAVDWFKGGVDYQDDVPVYVEFQPPIELYTLTLASGASYALRTRYEDAGGNWTGDDLDSTASLSYTASGAGERMAGFRCKDKDGVVWLQVTCARTRSSAYTGTSSFTNGHQDPGPTGWDAGDFEASIETSASDVFDEVSVFYLDLRYQCAAYTKTTVTQIDGVTTEHTAALEEPIFRLSFTRTGIGGTGNVIQTVDQHGETRVVMYGAQVGTYSGDKPQATTTTTTSGTGASVNPADFEDFGWMCLGAGILPFLDATRFATEVTTPPPDLNTPFSGFTASDLSTTSNAPLGVYFWEFHLDRVFSLAGTWPETKHLSPSNSVYGGAWGHLLDGWVYSMADLSGNTTVQKWDTAMSDGFEADDLTGVHGLDSLGKIWPMSRFVVGYTIT